MSTPATADTFEQKIGQVIAQTTRDDAGKLVFPDGLDEATLFAARAEIRRRDTQGALTKEQRQRQLAESQLAAVSTELEAAIVSSAPLADQARLAELKHSNPDAWREELTKLESTARGTAKSRIAEVRQAATVEEVTQERAQMLADFTAANPGFKLDDDIIANELPPRMVKELEQGKVSFDQFLAKAHKFLAGDVKIKAGDTAPNLPDLGKAPGGTNALDANVPDSNYAKEIY